MAITLNVGHAAARYCSFSAALCRCSGRKTIGLLSLRRATFSAEQGRLVSYLFAVMLLQK